LQYRTALTICTQQLLSHQLGVIHFSLLRRLFLSIYCSSHPYPMPLPSPPLHSHIRRNTSESSLSWVLPVTARTLQSIRSELAEGYRFVSNKLAEAQTTFASVLQALLLVVVSSNDEGNLILISYLAPCFYIVSGSITLLTPCIIFRPMSLLWEL
jgi:coatomer subunit alpha